MAAFIDAEHSMDPTYAKRIGVNVDELLVAQPDHGEQALEIADMLVRSGALDVVAIDSVAALVPKAEIEGQMGDSHVGLPGAADVPGAAKLAGTLNRAGTICVFTNQLREKIGVMFGSPRDHAGRPRPEVLRVGAHGHPPHRDAQGGHRERRQPHRVKVVKNKVAPPFQQAEFDIMYGEGISHEGNLLDLGVDRGIVTKSGANLSYGDERLGQGKNAARAFLREHTDIAEAIELRIREEAGPDCAGRTRVDPVTGEVVRDLPRPPPRSRSPPARRSRLADAPGASAAATRNIAHATRLSSGP